MAEHEPGNKARAVEGVNDILASAPIVDPVDSKDPNEIRRLYANSDNASILERSVKRSVGSAGVYGEGWGSDLFAPPTEFGGGYGGYGGFAGSYDSYSNPARYGFTCGYGNSNEGWTYRGGQNNIDHQRIAQCIMLYKTEGIVQTIVHLLADFAVEDVDLIHDDATVHNFYQAWQVKVRLKDRLHRFVVDLLKTGNVFVWTKEAKLKSSEKTAMKRGVTAQLIGEELVVSLEDPKGRSLRDKTINVEIADDQLARFKDLTAACQSQATAGQINEVMLSAHTRNDPGLDPEKDTSAKIPWEYISLNPLQMAPRGSRFANEHYWVMLLSQRDMKPLSRFMSYRYYSDISTTKVNLPEIFKGKLLPSQKGSPYAAELQLDEKRLSVIQDITKADYEEWATPQIYPAHKEVMFKRLMRQAEMSAVESMKHAITLIKLGDVKEGLAPNPAQIERVAAALAGGSQVNHLVWDDLIDAKVVQPNIGNIFDPKKYTQIDKDIYAALGVSEAVMSGKGSYANSFMSIKLLLEKLETIRCKLEDWLRVEVKKIADAMKFRRLPIIKWGVMNLRDENVERRLWIDLYDRGIISDASLLEHFGTDFDIELERQKHERGIKEATNEDIKKDDKKYRAPVMVSRGPFNREVLAPPKPAPNQAGKSGRPAQTGKPLTKKRNTKPKGMSSLIEFQRYRTFASSALKMISDSATELAIKAQDVRDSRSLTKAQKQNLEQIISYTLAALDPNTELTKDLVYDTIQGDDSTFSTSRCQNIISLYEQELNESHSKDERLGLLCDAFAAINSNILEGEHENHGNSQEG